MADENPTVIPRVIAPGILAARKAGRPKRCIPKREEVLAELWGSKKITVARVKALELLLKELPGANPETALSAAPAKVPSWMRESETDPGSVSVNDKAAE